MNCLNNYTVNSKTGCWEWNGQRDKKGYGAVFYNGKKLSAHRLSYETYCGKIRKGRVVMHSCDNPPCINPDHLSTGTIQDNSDDMVNKGRSLKGEKNHSVKLTKAEVLRIRKLNLPLREIAEVYGVSHVTVHYIKSRKRWSHV